MMDAICPQLPTTGIAFPIVAVTVVAIACFAFGLALLWVSRRRDRHRVSVVLLLVLGICVVVACAPPQSANAATPGCGDPVPAFTITQTSVITGLAPGMPAVRIDAVGTNTGDTSIFVELVVVRVSSVTKAPLAVAGTCDATDYVVENAQMPVNETVPPAGSVEFGGATIGFNNRATNQDACKGATAHLAYDVDES
jgi:drug/metabolite transporter (DMT)-like permease